MLKSDAYKKYKTNLPQGQDDQILFTIFCAEYMDIFATSFSADGDLLSQWRAYAADGRGFSFGIKTSSLLSNSDFRIIPIIYNQATQNQFITEIITILQQSNDINGFTSVFDEASLICKNSAFSEEREWRIVYIPDYISEEDQEPSLFRVTSKGLVRFHRWLFNPENVGRIVIGPANKTTVKDLEIFCSNAGIQCPTPEKSKASYTP